MRSFPWNLKTILRQTAAAALLCFTFQALTYAGSNPQRPIGLGGPYPELPACPDGPIFNKIPVDLKEIKAFRPLGFITLPYHMFGAKHSAFTINLPGEKRTDIPVYFPGDAWVTLITSIEAPIQSGYSLSFYPCSTFKAYFGHLGKISPHLETEFRKSETACQELNHDGKNPMKKCYAEVLIPVKSGELAGFSDGMAGVDFGAVDYGQPPHDFANPSRYDFDYLHYVSPVPYFEPRTRAELEAKTGSYDGTVRRTAEPKGGTFMQDLKGTAQGNWFLPGKNIFNTPDFSPFAALLHDYVDPSQPLFSMGNSVKNLPLGIYSFAVRSEGLVNRDFSAVTPGRIYCYEKFPSGQTAGKLSLAPLSGILLLTMPTAAALRIEYRQAASCAGRAWTLGPAATTFER